MNEQQSFIAWMGGSLIAAQFILTGQWQDIWNVIWDVNFPITKTSSQTQSDVKNIGQTLLLLAFEALAIIILVALAAGDEFGPPTIGLWLIGALWLVFLVHNSDIFQPLAQLFPAQEKG